MKYFTDGSIITVITMLDTIVEQVNINVQMKETQSSKLTVEDEVLIVVDNTHVLFTSAEAVNNREF